MNGFHARQQPQPPWPCNECGELMASRKQNIRYGVRRHVGHGRCERCYNAVRPDRKRPRVEPDIDDIAVERAVAGERLPLNCDERRLVVAALTARGVAASRIAYICGITQRQVVRHRARERAAA